MNKKKITRFQYRKNLINKVVPKEELPTAADKYNPKEALVLVKADHYGKVKHRYIDEVCDRMKSIGIKVIEQKVNFENTENFYQDNIVISYKESQFAIFFSVSGVSMYIGSADDSDYNATYYNPYSRQASRTMRTLVQKLERNIQELIDRNKAARDRSRERNQNRRTVNRFDIGPTRDPISRDYIQNEDTLDMRMDAEEERDNLYRRGLDQ